MTAAAAFWTWPEAEHRLPIFLHEQWPFDSGSGNKMRQASGMGSSFVDLELNGLWGLEYKWSPYRFTSLYLNTWPPVGGTI